MFLQRNFSLKTGILVTVLSVTCADAAAPFSQYGVIQNVQNYSSNPFYNASTGTVTAPRMVYASGPGLKPGECESVTSALVASVCNAQNNCKDSTLADIRPTLMVQLSLLPGGSYATSCAGYIDDAYQRYIQQTKTTNSVNVFKSNTQKTTTTTKSKKNEYNERAAELKALQSQTKTTTDNVTKADFPKTFDDLSFAQQNKIKQQGYEPYKDAQVYVPLNIVPEKPDYSGECMKIYQCIQNYDLQEQTAASVLFAAIKTYNKTKNADNKKKYQEAGTGLEAARAAACVSPCTCTTDIKKRDQYLNPLGVQCSDAFTNNCNQMAKEFVNNKIDEKVTK